MNKKIYENSRCLEIVWLMKICKFVLRFSQFVFFGDVVFRILQLSWWTHSDDEPYFNDCLANYFDWSKYSFLGVSAIGL